VGDEFEVKDSGERVQFESGMVRDTGTGKTDYTLAVDGPMFERWATHLTKACTNPDGTPGKYEPRNWMKATGWAEMVRFRISAFRHFIQWMRGEMDEDHAAAVFFNINGYEYVRTRVDLFDPLQPLRKGRMTAREFIAEQERKKAQ